MQYDALTEIDVTELHVIHQLETLDTYKAYGDDGVPPKLFKEGRNQICKLLCLLFNLSFKKGIVPSSWKNQILFQYLKKKKYFSCLKSSSYIIINCS